MRRNFIILSLVFLFIAPVFLFAQSSTGADSMPPFKCGGYAAPDGNCSNGGIRMHNHCRCYKRGRTCKAGGNWYCTNGSGVRTNGGKCVDHCKVVKEGDPEII